MDFFSSAPGCWLDLTWTIDMKLSIHATSWPAPAACCLAWAGGAKYADLWFACGGVEVGLGLGPSIMQMKEIIACLLPSHPTAIKSPPSLLIFFAQSPGQTLKCYLSCCILSKSNAAYYLPSDVNANWQDGCSLTIYLLIMLSITSECG